MFKYGIIFLLLSVFLTCQATGKSSFNKSPQGFIENKGQVIDQYHTPNPAVLYLLNSPGMNVQLRKGGFSYDLYRISNIEQRILNDEVTPDPSSVTRHVSPVTPSASDTSRVSYAFHRIDFTLPGSNHDCEIVASEVSSGYLNYYTTATPSGGVNFVHSYQKITYRNIYPAIDLEFITNPGSGVKYNFVVHKGGRLSDIRLAVSGPEMELTTEGTLMLKTTVGNIAETIPYGSFIRNGSKSSISPRFVRTGPDEFGITAMGVPADFNELLIDPVPTRLWATYYGGTWVDDGRGMAIDSEGNVYLSGQTGSATNIATSGTFQTTLLGVGDSYLAKFTASGVQLWGTYYGGPDYEWTMNCAVDKADNVYLSGSTSSQTNLSTPGCHQPDFGGYFDCYLVKFTPGGQRIWATYYGGTGDEQKGTVRTDDSCFVWLSGVSTSLYNIATPGSFQSYQSGGDDAFLVKFDSAGHRVWGTYFGGGFMDHVNDCAVSKNGYIYLTGVTASTSLISTPGSFQPNYGGSFIDGFLACFNRAGQRLWATYYGGSNLDECASVAADTLGNACISGYTRSSDNIAGPTAYQPVYAGNCDVFLARFAPDGSRLWGTYYGGANRDSTEYCSYIAVDDSCHVFLTGITNSTVGIATGNGYQNTLAGNYDNFLVKFDSSGQLIWGTYYGGASWERNGSAAIGPCGLLYFSGTTYSDGGMSTPGAHQETNSGTGDAYLVSFRTWAGVEPAQPVNGPVEVCQSTDDLLYTVPPIVNATGYQWTFPPGFILTGGAGTNSITLSAGPSAVSGTVSVFGTGDCLNGEPASLFVNVHSRPVPVITGDANACTGMTLLYTADVGYPQYIWNVSSGGSPVSGGTSTSDFIGILWNNAGSQWLSVNFTDNNGCTALTPTVKVVAVSAGTATGISIAASANDVCAGTQVTCTATPVNGGISPVYQWKVNGANAGTGGPLFSYTPSNGDVITCILTSSNTVCTTNNPATSNPVTMVVNPVLPVSIAILPSSNPVCAGAIVNFTATLVNGGNAPLYQWKVNAINANNANNATFSYSPLDGDVVTCEVHSSEACTTGNPALSGPVAMTVHANLPVGVAVTASTNPFCLGSAVTFTATPMNGGPLPAYQWQVNASNVNNANNAVFTYNPVDNDQVQCMMTSSLDCVTSNPATSGTIIMNGSPAPGVSFTTCFDTVTTISAKPYKLNGGLPLGGTFSGPGVNTATGVFTPSAAGTGLKTILYAYTNVLSCSATMSKTILVQPNPAFTCGNILTDIRDNKTYPTVQIGSQCWMQTNLDFGVTINDFTPQTDNCLVEKYIRDSLFNIQYSIFYQWDELMRYNPIPASQGLCPPGWHVPTSAEWDQLLSYYNGPGLAGGTLKDNLLTNGFQSHQSGFLYLNNTWSFTTGFAAGAMYWTSTTAGTERAVARGLNDYNMSVSKYEAARGNGFAVRCLHD